MKFRQIFQRLLGFDKTSAHRTGSQVDKSEMMTKVAAMLSNTQETELTCDEVYALLDQFVEMAARGEDVSHLMPLVKQHLDMCPDCMEEYKVLQSIVIHAA